MRKQQLLGALGLTVLVLFATADVAGAASEEELREECIHILEEGGSPDDCHEAPSPILPEWNEVIWGALSFLVVIGVVLIADGFDYHVPKGYIYFSLAFAVIVEMLNIATRRKSKRAHGA